MDGLYTLTLQCANNAGDAAQNISYWQLNGTNPADEPFATADDFNAVFKTHFSTLIRACMGNDVIIDFSRVRKVDAPTGPYSQLNWRQLGTIAHPCDSLVIAADIRLKPGGRNNRSGHWFFAGLPNTAFNGGRLISGVRAPLEAFAAALMPPLTLTSGTAELGTFSREIKPPKPPQPSMFTRTTDWEVAQKATGLNKRSLPLI